MNAEGESGVCAVEQVKQVLVQVRWVGCAFVFCRLNTGPGELDRAKHPQTRPSRKPIVTDRMQVRVVAACLKTVACATSLFGAVSWLLLKLH